jgi:hypothetical protein
LARKGRAPLRALIDLITEARPDVNAKQVIRSGRVVVDGRTLTNPASLVRRDAAITIRQGSGDPLRGEAKLAAALRIFPVSVEGRVALDLGAAAGGFTRVLLRRGARRVRPPPDRESCPSMAFIPEMGHWCFLTPPRGTEKTTSVPLPRVPRARGE